MQKKNLEKNPIEFLKIQIHLHESVTVCQFNSHSIHCFIRIAREFLQNGNEPVTQSNTCGDTVARAALYFLVLHWFSRTRVSGWKPQISSVQLRRAA